MEYTWLLQTVVETPAFLTDARSLGLPDAERLAIVTWIAANQEAGKLIEGTGGARKTRFAGKGQREEWWLPGHIVFQRKGHSGLLAQHICQEREN
jgi:hypothetical protein